MFKKIRTHHVFYGVAAFAVIVSAIGILASTYDPPKTSAENPTTLAAKDTSGVLIAKAGETEVVEKRTANFKTFALGNNQYRIGGDIGPIHYKADPFSTTEAYKEIDLTLKSNDSKSKNNDYDYYLDQNGYQLKIWNSRAKEKDVNYIAQFTRAGQSLTMAPVDLIWTNDAGETQSIASP